MMKKSRLRWFGHDERKDDNDWVKRCITSDVNKDWTCKDKEKDQAYKDQDNDKDLTHKDQDKDKDFTYSYLLQVAAKPTIAIKQQQWTQSETSLHFIWL